MDSDNSDLSQPHSPSFLVLTSQDNTEVTEFNQRQILVSLPGLRHTPDHEHVEESVHSDDDDNSGDAVITHTQGFQPTLEEDCERIAPDESLVYSRIEQPTLWEATATGTGFEMTDRHQKQASGQSSRAQHLFGPTLSQGDIFLDADREAQAVLASATDTEIESDYKPIMEQETVEETHSETNEVESSDSENDKDSTVIRKPIDPEGERSPTATPSSHVASLHLSGQVVEVPDTFDGEGCIPITPDAYGSIPIIIPSTPTEFNDSQNTTIEAEMDLTVYKSGQIGTLVEELDVKDDSLEGVVSFPAKADPANQSQSLRLHYTESCASKSDSQSKVELAKVEASTTIFQKDVLPMRMHSSWPVQNVSRSMKIDQALYTPPRADTTYEEDMQAVDVPESQFLSLHLTPSQVSPSQLASQRTVAGQGAAGLFSQPGISTEHQFTLPASEQSKSSADPSFGIHFTLPQDDHLCRSEEPRVVATGQSVASESRERSPPRPTVLPPLTLDMIETQSQEYSDAAAFSLSKPDVKEQPAADASEESHPDVFKRAKSGKTTVSRRRLAEDSEEDPYHFPGSKHRRKGIASKTKGKGKKLSKTKKNGSSTGKATSQAVSETSKVTAVAPHAAGPSMGLQHAAGPSMGLFEGDTQEYEADSVILHAKPAEPGKQTAENTLTTEQVYTSLKKTESIHKQQEPIAISEGQRSPGQPDQPITAKDSSSDSYEFPLSQKRTVVPQPVESTFATPVSTRKSIRRRHVPAPSPGGSTVVGGCSAPPGLQRDTSKSRLPIHAATRSQIERSLDDMTQVTLSLPADVEKESSRIPDDRLIQYTLVVETTTLIKTRTITIKTTQFGKVVGYVEKKEEDDPIVKRVSTEDIQILSPDPSPNRSVSTMTSGDLGDISSLSRSSSHASKQSSLGSLERATSSQDLAATKGRVSKFTSPESDSDNARPTRGQAIARVVHTGDGGSANVSLAADLSSIHHTHSTISRPGSSTDDNRGHGDQSESLFTSTDEAAGKSPLIPVQHAEVSPILQEGDDEGFDSHIPLRQSTTAGSRDGSELPTNTGFVVAEAPEPSSAKGKAPAKTTGKGQGHLVTKTKGHEVQQQQENTDKKSSSKGSPDDISPEIPIQDFMTKPVTPKKSDMQRNRLEPGAHVMARWKDGFYYPGVVHELKEINRAKIKFDDGNVLTVSAMELILMERMPIGQSVLVQSSDGYFDSGMISGYVGQGVIMQYVIEKDSGTTKQCSRCDVILSTDQAACILSQLATLPLNAPGTPSNMANVSLDNLVDGSRRSSKRNKLPEEPQSGAGSVSTKRRRLHEITPQATSTPTPKGKGNDPGTSKHSLIETPTSERRSPRKAKIGLFDDSIGSLPKKRTLFRSLTFILTYVDKTAEQLREERQLMQGSLLASSDENSGVEDTVVKFDKEHLKAQIRTGGGEVLDQFSQSQVDVSNKCYLISNSHQRTVKYFQCLAAGFPCVSHIWVRDCCKQGRLLNIKSYLLPAGYSLNTKRIVEWSAQRSSLMGLVVLVESTNGQYKDTWTSIMTTAGCVIATKLTTSTKKDDGQAVNVVITDNTCSKKFLGQAEKSGIPVVSSEWAIQSLINTQKVSYSGHPRYRYDSTEC